MVNSFPDIFWATKSELLCLAEVNFESIALAEEFSLVFFLTKPLLSVKSLCKSYHLNPEEKPGSRKTVSRTGSWAWSELCFHRCWSTHTQDLVSCFNIYYLNLTSKKSCCLEGLPTCERLSRTSQPSAFGLLLLHWTLPTLRPVQLVPLNSATLHCVVGSV